MIRHASLLSALTLATALAMPAFAQQQQAAPQQQSGPRVLVIPFTTLNVGDNQEWIGRAVQEDIIADFGRTNQFLPVAFQGQIVVEDNATAVSLAHKADATLVIRGSAQMVGPDLRITAQMIDARSGDTVTTASVTGPTADLLKLEDGLSAQLRTNLAAMQAPLPTQQPAAAQPDQAQASGPVTYAPSPAYAAQPAYTPGYSYAPTYAAPVYADPGYGYDVSPYYDYGYLGGPIVVYGGGFGFRGYGRGFSGGYHGGGFGGGGGGFHGGGGFSGGGGFHGGGGGGGGGGHR
jgi:TolB-like protein